MDDTPDHVRLKNRGHPSHGVYRKDGRVIVEWYDLGPDRPYESATSAIMDEAAQAVLRDRLGAAPEDNLVQVVGERFESLWDFETWAKAQGVLYERKVDFSP